MIEDVKQKSYSLLAFVREELIICILILFVSFYEGDGCIGGHNASDADRGCIDLDGARRDRERLG